MRILALLALPGCIFIGPSALDAQIDADGDGAIAQAYAGDDCDDTDPDVHPGAQDEPYDGIDSNCDGRDDFDADGDGLAAVEFGGSDCDDSQAAIGAQPVDWRPDCDGDDVPAELVVTSCGEPVGTQARGVCANDLPPVRWFVDRDGLAVDCDDLDPDVHPGHVDSPYDGIDSNCDGWDDFDLDRDGVPVDSDCDDLRADVFPGAPEVWYDGIDSNCDQADDFDQDADGARLGDDCDDTDPTRFPGAADAPYDGVDTDCAGDDDFDVDRDGSPTNAAQPDCDDLDPSVFPGAQETWYDGVDSDCDGANDYDADGDGWVRPEDASKVGDSAPFVGDCDDQRADVSPLATEVFYDGVDQDCDGADDFDQDADGSPAGQDCDDLDPTRHPGAVEIWYDGVDTDCSGDSDDDQDQDGVPVAQDCDDQDGARFPGAPDAPYDGIDANCDGLNDYDADGDGYVAAAFADQAGGTAPDTGDCDDAAASTYPGATDTPYDGTDSDCANDNDYDADRDGFVRTGAEAFAGGTAPGIGDCADDVATTNPSATDTWYDGIDANCDGADDFDQDADGSPLSLDCDDEDPTRAPTLPEQWYDGIDTDCDGADDFDQDRDGSPLGTDCDDLDPERSPSAIEAYYDGVDSNCDGANDYDQDQDGFVDANHAGREGGTAPGGGDCDDLSDQRFPGQFDAPYDGVDADCDGANDYDADADGVVAIGFGAFSGGTAPGLADCNDADPMIRPGEPEVWYDGIDSNCDGANDFDRDGDGAVRTGDAGMAGGTAPDAGDCDDGAATVRPGLLDQPYDGLDADCDGANDFDRDGDGYVSLSFPGTSGGTAPAEGDCDDLDGMVNPGATDGSGVDRNCDGVSIIDGDNDGVAADDDCDDGDPSVWVTDRLLVPGDPVAAWVDVACAGVTLTVVGEHLLDAPIQVTRPLSILGAGTLVAAPGERVLDVQADLFVQGVRLEGGSATEGGCIRVAAPALLAMEDAQLSGCVGNDGGAVWVEANAGVSIVGGLFEGNSADRGGAVFAHNATVDIIGTSFLGNDARQGGALHLMGGAPVLSSLLSASDDATEDGGFAWVQASTVDLYGLVATGNQSAAGAAALYLDDVQGRLEAVEISAARSTTGFNDPSSVVFLTGGDPTGTLQLEGWIVRSSAAAAGIRLKDLEGTIDVHDVEIGFHEGRYSLVGDTTGPASDLTIDNLWAHHQIAYTSADVVSLYPLLSWGSYWRLRNATITDNGANTGSLFVACHACGGVDVVNVLTGTDSYGLPHYGLMWIDTFGTQLHVRDTTTLHGTPWTKAYSGPDGFPPDCVDCGTLAGDPFVAPPPSFDVHLHPTSSLKGTGDASLCGGSTAPNCLDPGFWGGPRPPAER